MADISHWCIMERKVIILDLLLFYSNLPMLWATIIHHIHLHQLFSQFILECFIYCPIDVLNLNLWQNVRNSLMQFCQVPV